MKQARVAIIGQGTSGRDIHGACFRKNPEKFNVAAIVDPLEERRERARLEYPGADVYGHHAELFGRSDIDLVVNASPSHLHVPITMELLGHGLNTLCEKPLARYPHEVRQLIAQAEKNNAVLAVFQQYRQNAWYRKMEEVVQSGALGRVALISARANRFFRLWSWQTLREYNGGSLLNLGPHTIDQCLNLIGFPSDPPPEVCSALDRVNSFGDAEDFVKIILKTPGLPLVDIEINNADPYPPYLYSISGQYGGFTCTATEAKWKYILPEEAPAQTVIQAPLVGANGEPSYCNEDLIWHEGYWKADAKEDHTAAVSLFYEKLLTSLFEGAPLPVTPQQVALQIEIMARVHEQNKI